MLSSELPVSEKSLLNAITSVLSHYITETDPYVLFNGLLDTLLEITASEYGFIGEVFYSQERVPYIKSYATTDITWNQETKALYEETKRKGMLFSRLDSLYGAVLKTGQLVISNQPISDPRRCGIPPGHPPLNAFMGIPFYGGGELLGVVGIANREGGYHQALADSLQPFLLTCGNLIQAYRKNIKNQQVEAELSRYKERLQDLDNSPLNKNLVNQPILLGNGYQLYHAPLALIKAGKTIALTQKELSLLEILTHNVNLPTPAIEIEKHVWKEVIVGESSLRTLLLRLRKKLPELNIKTVSGVGYMLVMTD